VDWLGDGSGHKVMAGCGLPASGLGLRVGIRGWWGRDWPSSLGMGYLSCRCLAELLHHRRLADGSDGRSGDGVLGLGGELLASGLGPGMLGTWEM